MTDKYRIRIVTPEHWREKFTLAIMDTHGPLPPIGSIRKFIDGVEPYIVPDHDGAPLFVYREAK